MDETGMAPKLSEILCIGETMAQVSAVPPDDLLTASSLTLSFAGAESTVALYLARLGWRAAWMSRMGDDPFGRRFLRILADSGVDASRVELDENSPTGVYFKHPTPDGTDVYYYRAGSAAAQMSPAMLTENTLEGVRLVHLSGINPALSTSMGELVKRVFEIAAAQGIEVSFDINYRPRLWTGETAAPVLLDLARRADVVFVGLDEAQALWGSETAEEVAHTLGTAGEVVVKDGDVGATVFCGLASEFAPAFRVDVVEPVGAGDSFAAGYLHERLKGGSLNERLGRGHELAARALQTTEDFVDPRGGLDVSVH